ncbi:MAG: parallel beta-helix domain-containing protein [Candidatus Sulfotelmatobacter sp.]
MTRSAVAALLTLLSSAFVLTSCNRQLTPEQFQKHLQEQLIRAKPGDVIDLPEGKFHLDRTLSLTADNVSVRGKGMNKTILSFAGQREGASGMLVKANGFTAEDFAIEDTAGDGLTVQGASDVIIRRVRVEWTHGPNPANGPYAIYPTECKNVLVEDSVAKGAADAGFYIGQSDNVVMRRNDSEYNVDGYEVENAQNVDVYDNVAAHNAGGIGVFNLPDLPKQGGQHVRVFRNQVYENNTPNFAPKSLGPIYFLPTGTGVYIMAIHDVEEFQNKIRDNNTTNVFLMAYDSTLPDPTTGQPGIHDARFRPYTDHIYLHDNEISGGGKSPDTRLETIKAATGGAGGMLPDILYDGVVDPAIRKASKDANPGQICLMNNGSPSFLNFDADNSAKHPVRNLKSYECTLPPQEAVKIPQVADGSSKAAGGQ